MLFDVDGSKAEALAEKLGAECFNSMHRVVHEADLALLCTPIKETPKVIREAIPHMRKGAIICEIASLKLKTVEALKSASDQGIQPVSIHPMFGPDIESIAGQTIILVPVSDPRREECVTRYLFPGAEVAALDAETHDYYMAAILSLTYFANLVFAKSMQRMDPMLLRRLAGTTFTVQHALAQSVVEESPELVESLISENAYAKEAINGFIDDSRYL
ncbi:MAG: prephenate dehydrogenase/arogenate dehydrogenase family protein, partial [Candidatus Bathyarchaeia archaeon]